MGDAREEPLWNPTDDELSKLAHALVNVPEGSEQTKILLINTLEKRKNVAGYAAITKRLDDQDANVRNTVIAALVRLGDKQAVAPLVAKLDDQDVGVRMAVIGALGQLGDKQAVTPLLVKLDDQDANVRMAVIGVLGRLDDKQAVAPLLAKLDDQDVVIGATAAVALQVLGEPKGIAALTRFLASEDAEIRQVAVGAYSQSKNIGDQLLLSRDLDASVPWIDTQESVTEDRVAHASSRLNMTPEEIRSLYEAIAVDLNLKLSWKA